MLRIVTTISALLAGIALLLMGSGLLNTLVPLRGATEGFSDQALGLFGSAYFAGFMLGTWVCPKLIRRMGHIRAFAFFASAAAACIILHVIHVDMLFWLLLRLITGMVLVGVYTSIESWLNTGAPKERRGRVFAVYMAVNLGALALSQQLLQMENPLANLMFGIAALFVIVAIMPVVATRLPQPEILETTTLSLKALWRAAPVACAGAVLSGLAMGGFWGLGALYAGRVGMDTGQIATFMSLVIVAGALFQWPMGVLSDRIDRRLALVIVAGIAAVGGLLMALLSGSTTWLLVGAVIFGAGSFSVYPTVVAHLIDHLHKEEVLSGNAGLLMLQGVGSAIGPALAGWLMGVTSTLMLPLYFAVMFAASALFSLLRWRDTSDRIVEEPAHHVSMVTTSPEALEMVVDEQKPDEAAGPVRTEAGDDGIAR
ncbi:MFS transporter [Pseudomonas sp. G11-1]|uniref:Predicted arabinose efflux permease, MFS family n=1 Tax=Halopseudomonas bauzanensis TaxID=653930 RepID=A0A031MB51_9GAMM|nr:MULTISPECIES: MFS transporter [Halopseudomonas]MCO5786139.1 MFS transporter [Pseudomonas sp. G11-1]MCO5789365.1 MFS transporter [Pseudomonas sp. G11-2]EZQ17220.1 MFS transporter [Halopseudomonas bauzanensis]WGK62929.1 MFS transporter [Halopseudomonas sp. SMJS2]SES12392.1 Predicted arabinose efflux permease, MFS family [Halopseudomonas bauzanensis]